MNIIRYGSQRHDLIFPMFEFEAKGDMEALKNLESELLIHLGFPEPVTVDYEEMCQKYDVREIDDDCEEIIGKDYGTSVILEKFPHVRAVASFYSMCLGCVNALGWVFQSNKKIRGEYL